jgi:TP901 family phage tail tape measure protein
MADRTVVVRLVGQVGQFNAAMAQAGTSVSNLQRQMSGAQGQASGMLGNLGNTSKAMMGLGAVGLGLAMATRATMEFDKAMSAVKANVKATEFQHMQMRDAALKAGRTTVYTAKEAASAQMELGKAGVGVADILGGALSGALNLAAAGDMNVADAAEIAASAMTQFALKGRDVVHIADVLSATANKAQGSVHDVGIALKYIGPIAGQMGVSLEQTAGSIGLIASNGILADQAGTGLRGMITSLTSPSAIAKEEMTKLGISAYDAQGKFIGFAGLASQMQANMKGLSEADRDFAMGRIFGNAQIQVARILYNAGANGINKWTTAVNDSGAAERNARERMNNWAGDLKKANAALNEAAIDIGENLTPALRGLTQGFTGLVHGFTSLPGPAQAAMAVLGGWLLLGDKIQAGGNRMAESMVRGSLRTVEATRVFREAAALQRESLEAQARSMQLNSQIRPSSGGIIRGMAGDYARVATEARNAATAAGYQSRQLSGASAAMGRYKAMVADAQQQLNGMSVAQARVSGGLGIVKAAGTGLMGAMGGPWGLAIAAASLGLMAWASHADKSREKTERFAASVKSLKETLLTYGSGSKEAQSALLKEVGPAGIKAGRAIGLDPGEMSSLAIKGDDKAIKFRLDKIRAERARLVLIQQSMNDTRGPGGSERFEAAQAAGPKIAKLDEGIKDWEKALKAAAEASREVTQEQERQATALGMTYKEYKNATPQVVMMESALRKLSEAGASVKDRVTAYGVAINGLIAPINDARLAQADYAEMIIDSESDIAEAFTKQKNTFSKSAREFSLTTKSGIAQTRAMAKMHEGLSAVAESTYAKVLQQSGSSTAAAIAASDAWNKGRSKQIEVVAGWISGGKKISASARAMATSMVDAFNQVPKEIAMTLRLEGGAKTLEDLRKVGITTQTLPDGRVVIHGKGEEAERMLREMGLKVEQIKPGFVRVTAVGTEEAEALIQDIARTYTARIRVQVAREDARSRGEGLHHQSDGTNQSGGGFRWGGIQSYAGGGIAKIAGPGTLYQWAEPETGGEAFIPRKGDPRRSQSILETAASWYGLKVSKMAAGGVMSFAAGGITAPVGDLLSRYDAAITAAAEKAAAAAAAKLALATAAADRNEGIFTAQRGVNDSSRSRADAAGNLAKNERDLARLRADGKATPEQIADAEEDLARSRRALAAANEDLTAAQRRLNTAKAVSISQAKVAAQPTGFTRFSKAMALGVKNTNAFLWALKLLADRGYGTLAQNLLAMGGPEAEQIAQGALKASDAVLRSTSSNVATAAKQSQSLANMPAMLAVRSALKTGASYSSLLGSGQVDAASLNQAITLMRAELSKTAAGKAMIAAMGGANQAAIMSSTRRFAKGGIAGEGTLYRYAEPGTGGEALIPRRGDSGQALSVLKTAAGWHGASVRPWQQGRGVSAAPAQVHITVRGEGVLSSMIEAKVDGRLVQVARSVRHGSGG